MKLRQPAGQRTGGPKESQLPGRALAAGQRTPIDKLGR